MSRHNIDYFSELVTCPFMSNHAVLPDKFDEHVRSCPAREFTCPFDSHHKSTAADIREHLLSCTSAIAVFRSIITYGQYPRVLDTSSSSADDNSPRPESPFFPVQHVASGSSSRSANLHKRPDTPLFNMQSGTRVKVKSTKHTAAAAISSNPIGELQELCIKHELPPPIYREVARSGPDHASLFTMHVTVNNKSYTGFAGSKAAAKKDAAQAALNDWDCIDLI
jgi:hypothetical protein